MQAASCQVDLIAVRWETPVDVITLYTGSLHLMHRKNVNRYTASRHGGFWDQPLTSSLLLLDWLRGFEHILCCGIHPYRVAKVSIRDCREPASVCA